MWLAGERINGRGNLRGSRSRTRKRTTGASHPATQQEPPSYTASHGVRSKGRYPEAEKDKSPEAKVNGVISVQESWLETHQPKAGVYK